MKITEGFMLRKVGDESVVITIGEALDKFNGMIKLNASGVFIWEALQTDISKNDLINEFASEYSISEADAERDIDAFLDSIRKTGCISE